MDKIIEIMRKKIKKGMILELTSKIEDPYSPKEKGSRFMAEYIDDAGQIHGKWSDGGSIALICGKDDFEIVEMNEISSLYEKLIKAGEDPEHNETFLEQLWESMEDIPMDPESEKLEQGFWMFPSGTPKMKIWSWFDERYPYGVIKLLNIVEMKKEATPFISDSNILPAGWKWRHYCDGSGSLCTQDGNTYLSYDLETREYMFANMAWEFFPDYPEHMSRDEFVEFAEKLIKKKLEGENRR